MAVFDRSHSSVLFSSAFHVKAQGFSLPICEKKSSNRRGSARLKNGFGSRDPFCCNLVSMGRNTKETIALAHSYSHEGFEFDRRSRRKNIGVVNAQQQQEEDDYKGEDDEHSSEALKATLEQSKRVLAMQKQLIEQIAERRKFVSSLKEKMGSSSSQGIDDEDTTLQQNNQNEKLREIVEKHEETNDKDRGFADKQVGFEEDYPKGSKAVSEDRSNDARRKARFLERSPSSDFSKEASASQSKSSLQTVVKTDISTPKNEVVNEVHTNLDEQRYAKSFAKQENISHSQEGESRPPPLAGTNVMNIVVVAAECAPWSKTGGLGDVAGSLPKALARRGHRVMVVAPRYGDYHEGQDVGVCQRYSVNGQDFEVRYQQAYIDNVDFVFINCAIFRGLQKNIYQGNRQDVLRRMVLLCKAAVEVPWHVPCGGICYGDGNLVFIANDWHTALLPVYLQAYYRDNGLMKFTRSVLVIHNLAHQGRGPVADFKFLDLPDRYLDLFKLYDPVGGEHMNVFMAGIKAAHRIVAVSHGYAWECQTVEGGWGLHEIMKESSWKLRGIVNGIDENDWNPEVDVYLKDNGYCNYSLETLEAGKPACKAALQRELGLPVRPDVALIGFIGRLDHQKGVDLIAEAIPWMVEQDMQLVMLGMGRADLEEMLRSFEGNYHDKVRGWVGFCVKTAHRITAGCDILLMPSRFEPCGLNQLYAMRYGTVPVVHAVGGLRDTVQPFDPFQESGFGWTFDSAEPSRLIHSLGNAMWTYRDYKESWKGIQRRGMSQDLSWDNAAKQYEEVLLAAKYQW